MVLPRVTDTTPGPQNTSAITFTFLCSWPSERFYYSNLQHQLLAASERLQTAAAFIGWSGITAYTFTPTSLFTFTIYPYKLHSFVSSGLNRRALSPGFRPAAWLRVQSSCFPGVQPVTATAVHPHAHCWGTRQPRAPPTHCWPCTDLAPCHSRAGVRAAAWATGVALQAVCWALNFNLTLAGEWFQIKSFWILYKISKRNSHTSHLNPAWSRADVRQV